MIENWADIEGYEGLYQVSNLGRVQRLERFDILIKKTIPLKSKAINDNSNGYKIVKLWKNNEGKIFYIHRLVAQAFILNPENKTQVNHKDKDKSNNNVDNLEWCTSLENNIHKNSFKGYIQQGVTMTVYYNDGSKKEYKSISDGAKQIGCHRDTIYNFLAGNNSKKLNSLGVSNIKVS